jgi:hypothetical protein
VLKTEIVACVGRPNAELNLVASGSFIGNQLPALAIVASCPAHVYLPLPHLRFLWDISVPNLQPTHTTTKIPDPFFFHFFLLHISHAPISVKPSSRKLNLFLPFLFLSKVQTGH